MKTNPLKEGKLTINSSGIGTVTRKMVLKRAAELAIIDGRSAQKVTKTDLAIAKRELTGQTELESRKAALESAPESERWDPLPGSEGRKVPVSSGEDEDDEGRSDNERLVEEGVEEAELDKMDQAAQADSREGEK
jgi:hypothetical protein